MEIIWITTTFWSIYMISGRECTFNGETGQTIKLTWKEKKTYYRTYFGTVSLIFDVKNNTKDKQVWHILSNIKIMFLHYVYYLIIFL